MADIDLAALKELMGYSQISFTMCRVHPTPEHKKEAVKKLEEFNVKQVSALYENREDIPNSRICSPDRCGRHAVRIIGTRT